MCLNTVQSIKDDRYNMEIGIKRHYNFQVITVQMC